MVLNDDEMRYQRGAAALAPFLNDPDVLMNPEDVLLMAFAVLKFADSDASFEDIDREVRAMIAEDRAEHGRMMDAMGAANPAKPNWVPFKYLEFYDVPRMILFDFEGTTFLFDSPFDEDADDYDPSYTIYMFDDPPDTSGSNGWTHLPSLGRYVGEVPVSLFTFDPTTRAEIDVFPVERLMRESIRLRADR